MQWFILDRLVKAGREQWGLQHVLVSRASPAFAVVPLRWAMANVLEAERGVSDAERLQPCCLSTLKRECFRAGSASAGEVGCCNRSLRLMQCSLTLLLREAELKAIILNYLDSSAKGSGRDVGFLSALAKS